MRRTAFVVAAVLLAAGLRYDPQAAAQGDPTAAVTARDTAFWQAYNACDTAAMRTFFTEDVEFYHDRGGATIGLAVLGKALDTSLCGGANKIRRAPVPETIRVSVMRKGEEVYGAIVSGEHLFYVREEGKPEFLDGRAAFANLWLLKDGVWKMSRILSYDHGPATK